MSERTAALVAWYAQTGAGVPHDSLGEILAAAAESFGPGLCLRDVSTLHATVIGLDAVAPVPCGDEIAHLGTQSAVDVPGLVGRALAAWSEAPPQLQFGGFARTPGTSRGRPLAERSAWISNGQLVLLGWPADADGRPTDALGALRRSLAEYRAVHRYGPDDPEVHVVLGELDDPEPRHWAAALLRLRERLATHPRQVRARPEHLGVVVYRDARLPLQETVLLDTERLASHR